MMEQLINKISTFNNIKFIYINTNKKQTKISINIIYENNYINQDIEEYNKIIALIEKLNKELLNKKIKYSINIKSLNVLLKEVENNNERTINELLHANIIHTKDQYYQDFTEKCKKIKILTKSNY